MTASVDLGLSPSLHNLQAHGEFLRISPTQIVKYYYCELIYISQFQIYIEHMDRHHQPLANIPDLSLLASLSNLQAHGEFLRRSLTQIVKYDHCEC